MMNRNEMIERASKMNKTELENARFYNEMVDRWTNFNYEWNKVLNNEINKRK